MIIPGLYGSNNRKPAKHQSSSDKPAVPVFERLYSQQHKKVNKFKPSDARTTEQKQIEEHCTFRPKVLPGCPFVSERGIRDERPSDGQRVNSRSTMPTPADDQLYLWNVSSRSQHGTYMNKSASDALQKKEHSSSISPFYYFRQGSVEYGDSDQQLNHSNSNEGIFEEEEVVEEVVDFEGSSASSGGLFIPGFGLVRGPPSSAGIPLFYFNPQGPPSFELGSYLSTKEVEVDHIADDDSFGEDESASKSANSAPPLPSWAFGPGGDPQRNQAPPKDAVKKLVITKAPVVEKQEATG